MGERYHLYGLIGCLIAVVVCVAAAIFFTNQIDTRQREELIKQVSYVSLLVSADDVLSLSATEADLANPVYTRIKTDFASFKSYNPDIRFVYLMGYSPEVNSLFFHADSESPSSDDYSPPGQIYPDTAQEDIDLYLSGKPYTEGPYKDSWGEWVSGITPIRDNTGSIVAIVGIDIATHVWFEQIVFVRLVFLVVAILLCIIIYILANRFHRKEQSLSDLKSQNSELKQRGTKLDEIQSLAQVGRVTYYFVSKIIVIDKQFLSLFGNDRLSFDEFQNYVHQEDKESIIDAISEMKEKDINYAWFDARIGTIEKGFRKYHFSGNVERDNTGVSEKFAGIMQDITDIT